MPEYVLKMEDIRKSFGGSEVLKGITVRIERGEVCAVIGPSGSGKSTLLRCATLLERIDSGMIAYSGNVLAHTPDSGRERGRAVYCRSRARRSMHRRFGLVFQQFNLFPHFSVSRNITEAMVHAAKLPEEEASERAAALLAKMGLSDKADEYPYQLSGGQQQRVAIARSLALSPDILFFDEPTSALDPELTGEILLTIRELAREKMTMVIVTHEMGFARDAANRVVFMDGGVIIEEGSPNEVIERPQHERTRAFLNRFLYEKG